ncbi:MAG: zinc-ribbon domain-containing protein [Deltaproteobacteria bacterium]|nr:zinc-ribbon domain-containing protein [Deltaproteobacteria bacterium]
MIVQCQKCKTKFKLPDEKIQPGGTKVRCGKCSTVFRVTPAKPVPPAPPPDNSVFGEETRIAPTGMLEALEQARIPARAAVPETEKKTKVVAPRNPFVTEPPAAPLPAPAAPRPMSGEKREFFVPPVSEAPSPGGRHEFRSAPAAGVFGTETVVAPAGLGDLDAIMSQFPIEEAAAPQPPLPAERHEFFVPEQPAPARAPQPAGVFGGETMVVSSAGLDDLGAIMEGLAPEAAPAAPAYATETVVSPPAPLNVNDLMPRVSPAPARAATPSGEKREFVVPSASPEPARGPRQAALKVDSEVDVDSLFDGLFVKEDGFGGAAPALEQKPEQAEPSAAAGTDLAAVPFPTDISADLSGLAELSPPPGEQPAGGDDRWADLGADLIGGAGLQAENLAASAAREPVAAPPQPPAAEPAAGAVDAVASVQGAFSDDLARSLQEEINRQFELHFKESPGPMPGAEPAVPQAAPATQGAAVPGAIAERRPAVENPFAAPFAVGIGSPVPANAPPAAPVPEAARAGANPFLQIPEPLSSPLTVTAPPSPAGGSGSTDLLPQIPDSPALPPKHEDPFAGLDLSAPVGTGAPPDAGRPPLAKFASQTARPGSGSAQPNDGFLDAGFSSKENDLFAQLESINVQPSLGPRIEQLPARGISLPDPTAVPGAAAGFDLDSGGAASFVQHMAGGMPAGPPGGMAAGPSGVSLSEEAVKHARPAISKVHSAAVPAVRREMKTGFFRIAAPWVFTALLLAGTLALLGLHKGKVAVANVISNLSPASAGGLNKYTIQGFKLYTTAGGRRAGVVTGNVKADGAVDPAAVKITFELADYANYVAFRGEFFPTTPLTPEEVYELDSQEKAYAKLGERRLKTGAGKWLPFQVVFFDPPERLERFAFRIDVAGVP